MRRRRRGARGKIFSFLIFFTIVVFLLMFVAESQFSPVIKALAQQKAYMVTVRSMQEAAQRQIHNFEELQDYQQLMHIEKDETGKIVLMIPNIMKINLLVSAIVLDAEAAMSDLSEDELKIPLGIITGTKLLASLGPSINVEVTPISMVYIEVKDEFISAGINQTRHRIWLEMNNDISLAIPFDREILTVSTSILLSEGIIVGPIPETYINFSLWQ